VRGPSSYSIQSASPFPAGSISIVSTGGSHCLVGDREPWGARTGGLDGCAHRRVANGIAPVDDPALRRQIDLRQTRRHARELLRALVWAWQWIGEREVGHLASDAPVRTLALFCSKAADHLALAQRTHLAVDESEHAASLNGPIPPDLPELAKGGHLRR
jgi:hypothetical protein